MMLPSYGVEAQLSDLRSNNFIAVRPPGTEIGKHMISWWWARFYMALVIYTPKMRVVELATCPQQVSISGR